MDCSQPADACIVNSCTVTATGDGKSKKAVSHLRKKNPDAIIALIGCFPQAFPEKAEMVAGADIVLGTKDKMRVIELLEQCFLKKQRYVALKPHESKGVMEQMQVSSFAERTRAFVKIQDGCNRFCSYCIIPTARGRICSKPLEELVSEVETLVSNGHCEIVLVGIDLSSYGKEFGKTLTDAVEAVAGVCGVKRIRLGSLEPEIISDEDIRRLAKIKSFCPQFHLSLQSGCDKTLKRMNRHYTIEEYRTIVKKLRSAFENATVTTDVMVGFAGESEEEFLQSLSFVCEMRFLKVHVFPYSIREGTRAAGFPDQISAEVKRCRAHRMIEETERIRKELLQEKIGKTAEVLVESREKNGFVLGYTAEYIPVFIENCKEAEGSLITVRLSSLMGEGMSGILVTE